MAAQNPGLPEQLLQELVGLSEAIARADDPNEAMRAAARDHAGYASECGISSSALSAIQTLVVIRTLRREEDPTPTDPTPTEDGVLDPIGVSVGDVFIINGELCQYTGYTVLPSGWVYYHYKSVESGREYVTMVWMGV